MYDIEKGSVAERAKTFVRFLNESKKDHLENVVSREIDYICGDGQLLVSGEQVKELYERFDEFYEDGLWSAKRVTVVDTHTAYVSISFNGRDRDTQRDIELRSIQKIEFNPLGKIVRIESDRVFAA